MAFALVAICLLGLVGLELVLRFYVGLGDPPLSIVDAEVGYRFKPDSKFRRFGRDVSFNSFSMRSGPVTTQKTNPQELRIMVIGDSVVNGGALTDDSELATAHLQQQLSRSLGRPVYVGNISAGSWGPPNQLAFVKKFGLFDADAVVLVLSSHDLDEDDPDSSGVGRSHDMPDKSPTLALTEFFFRYTSPGRWMTSKLQATSLSGGSNQSTTTSVAIQTSTGESQPTTSKWAVHENSVAALEQLLTLCSESRVPVIVVQHPELSEVQGDFLNGHSQIAQIAQNANVRIIQLQPAFAEAMKAGKFPYRPGDVIHPSAAGQQVIAKVLLPVIESVLEYRRGPSTTSELRQGVKVESGLVEH